MQYTASSFARSLVGLFAWMLRPRSHEPRIAGAFPSPSSLETHVDDAVLDRAILPLSDRLERRFGWLRGLQQGLTQNYVLYVLITLAVLLATLVPFREILALLLTRRQGL